MTPVRSAEPHRAERGRTRRADILARAAELFAERGYRTTTLSELADAAGIAKATLFHHFRTKEEILFALYTSAMELAMTSVTASNDRYADPAEAVHEMVREYTLMVLRNKPMFTIFFHEENSLEPEHRAEVRAQQRACVEVISSRVSELSASGKLRSSTHPRIATQILLGAASWAYRWAEEDRALSTEEIATIIADQSLQGLLTRD